MIPLELQPHKPTGQQFPLWLIVFYLRLVLQAHVSLRAAARVLSFQRHCSSLVAPTISWTTGRWWLLRLGLAELRQPKERAPDWVWFTDFSVQIGKAKCLVIVALRQAHLPPKGQCLRHEHLRLIHLALLHEATQQHVLTQLEAAASKIGAPRAIVSDHGSDLHGGIRMFIQANPSTVEIYDITHKCACLLKQRLNNNPRWSAFGTQAATTKVAIQQTELAALAPPNQRSKARYMNLAGLLGWADKVLLLLSQPTKIAAVGLSVERVTEKLNWLESFRADIREWREWHDLVVATEQVLRQETLAEGIVAKVAHALTPLLTQRSGIELGHELIKFVAEQAAKLSPGERLPATTEVLESCFGKLKALEKDQAKNGFTALVLALGAMVGKRTEADVEKALQKYPVKAVKNWCQKNLPQTVQAQRRRAYELSSSQGGPEKSKT